ncbi:hypothetical protein CKA32_006546 [Geitlerinema sp. FC II]|nr:hypothetical protein CKA32_006546 [Geitlerinema sp. FC II]
MAFLVLVEKQQRKRYLFGVISKTLSRTLDFEGDRANRSYPTKTRSHWGKFPRRSIEIRAIC